METGQGRTARRGRGRVPLGAWLALPALVGAALRLARLRDQVLGGDELHALRVALSDSPAAWVAYRFDANAPALTLFYRLVLELGLPLCEGVARLPALGAGVLLLLAVPWALERVIGRAPAVLLAWLLALSPSLVFYSRIARSYLPVTLLGFAAAWAVWTWLRTGGARPAAAYAGCAALAVYLHLGAAPFVAAPAVFAAALRLLAGPRDRRALGSLALLVGGAGLATGALLLPSLDSLLWLGQAVRREHDVYAALDASTAAGVATLLLGARPPWLSALLGLAVVRGLVVLARARPRFAAYVLWLVAAQVAGLLILAPLQLHQPLVFGRYLLIALPWLLCAAAVGLAAPWSPRQPRPARAAQLAAAYALPALALLTGPLAAREGWSRSLFHHNDYVGFHRSRGTLPDEAVPAFYLRLRDEAPDGAVLEYPMSTWWNYARAARVYAEIHRRRVIASSWEGWLYGPGMDLRNSVAPEPDRYLASPARFAVIHRDMGAEEARVREAPGSLASELHPRTTRELRDRSARAGRRLLRSLERAWGAPDVSDDDLAVWDLERIRGARRTGADAR